MAYLDSDRGTANATLTDPTGPLRERSARGVANAKLVDPVPPGETLRPSRRGVANATLAAPVIVPDGWQKVTIWQEDGGVMVQIMLQQGSKPVQIYQYAPHPSLDPGYARSARGIASFSVGTWVKPVIGVTAAGDAKFNELNAQVGPVLARRTYNTTLPSSWAKSAASADVGTGRMSYWSWKPNVKTFPTDQAAQNAFSAFLDTIPAGQQCVIVAWHEPENDIDKGDYTLNQWGALQDAVHSIVKSKKRPELRTGICLMGPWTFDTRSGRTNWDWAGCMDWSLVDVVGCDPYRTSVGTTTSLKQMMTVRNSGSGTGNVPPMMDVLRSWGKPISLMEWGATQGDENNHAAFISDAYAWMKEWNQQNRSTPIESAMWFNNTMEGNFDIYLTGAALTAYKNAVADSKKPV